VLQASNAYGYPFGSIVQLLLLTGQRRIEIGSLRWSYVDETKRTITLPATLTKNHREHTIPFGDRVAETLASIPRMGDIVFPARGREGTSFSGWSKSKPRFDQICEIEHWTLHDLRRTFATLLAGLEVQPHIIERLLNHATGHISGIAAVYNRYAYMDEMRNAISRYDVHVAKLLSR
jgi:integrase